MNCVYYAIRAVESNGDVNGYEMFTSTGDPEEYDWAIRPVVSLTSSLGMTYDAATNTVTLK